MATLNTNILRNNAAWDSVATAITNKGGDVSGQSVESYATAIDAIVTEDDLACTPELKQFPDIRAGLTDSTFKMVVLRNSTGAIGIAVTLPTGQSGSINWGDGNTTALTASGSAVNYYHTWASWQTSADGVEDYNIVTVSGNVTAISAIASAMTAPIYWHTVLWIATKSSSLLSLLIGGTANVNVRGLRRCDFDAQNLVLGGPVFLNASALTTLHFNGLFGSSASFSNASLFQGVQLYKLVYSSSYATSLLSMCNAARIRALSLTLRTDSIINYINLCNANPVLRRFTTNAAWGSFSGAFDNCPLLKELNFENCPVNGISAFTAANAYSLLWVLFPSYVDTDGIRKPKAFASGVTSMGAINITNSGLSRAALVEMFRSLPVNAAPVNCTIAGSVGAAYLTAEEIAIATNKNWNVIRA